MILIISNRLDPHVDAVISYLKDRKIEFIRFNTENFPQKIRFFWETGEEGMDGTLHFPRGTKIKLSQITSCWYRRPASVTVSAQLVTEQARNFAEEETNALLSGLWRYLFGCFWINYPFKIHSAESKIYNLRLAAEIGFCIPRTLITNDQAEARNFFYECGGNLVNKVLGKGQVEYLKDYYFIYTHRVLPQDLGKMSDVVFAPTMFQEYISKKMEIRITVVGDKVFSCEIYSQKSKKTADDWRHYDLENVPHLIHKLPLSIEKLCLTMMERLGLNFATFDLVLTPEGKYVFLELNPNGQWLWIEQLTGMPISQAIAELLISRGKDEYKK